MSRIQNKNLTVYYGNENISNVLSVFKGFKAITLNASTYLYIGYKKPIHSLSFDFNKVNTLASILVIEKYNGTEWVIVDRQDETFDFNKSGNIHTEDFTEALFTHKGINQYWTRISFMNTTTEVELRYLNLLLGSPEDLSATEFDIELYYPQDGESNTEIRTFLQSFMAAREAILHKLNQAGKYTYNGIDVKLLNQWDIFNINELRVPNKHLVLHYIYMSRFDNKEDATKLKADYHLQMFNDSFAQAHASILTLDTNNNGSIDDEEVEQSKSNSFRLNL